MKAKSAVVGAAIATVDGAATEYTDGHIVSEGGLVVAIGSGPLPEEHSDAEVVDGRGCLVTPGLVNTHHHLYQWATRGYAQQCGLFGWLTQLYPVWAGLTAEITHAAAGAGLAWLAKTGCTTAADHHYVFPRDGGDTFAALVSAAGRIGIRLHAVRGSMDRGYSDGGLPPDSLVESIDAALRGTQDAIDRFHDPRQDAVIRVAVGPCSPFTVSESLMTEAAALARSSGVRMHTHLAETSDEQVRCAEEFGCTPAEYAQRLGWLADDVWLAHGVHLSEVAVKRFATTRTGVAHCPTSNGRLGSGIAPVRGLLDAGVPVGLGVDGAASNESCGMVEELHEAMLLARQRSGPDGLSAREALWMATAGGAACLGRQSEIGSIEPGKLADLAVWRIDGIGHAGIEDPVAALVFGPRPALRALLVGGRPVVVDGELRTSSENEIARELRVASRAMARQVEAAS